MGEGKGMKVLSRLWLCCSPLLVLALVAGCKTAEKQEDEVDAGATAPATTTEPSASATATATAPLVVSPPIRPTPSTADAGTTPTADAGTTAITDAGTTTTSDAGTTGADAGVAAGAAAAFKACSEKCQAILQGCVIPTPSKDGGLPQIKDPVACQAAATACVAACRPQ
jgi:hypothetical protein